MDYETSYTLERLLPRLQARLSPSLQAADPDWQDFLQRVQQHFPRLFQLLCSLYQGHYDFFFFLEELLLLAAQSWLSRSPELKALDRQHEQDPAWFQSNQALGGVCYVDLFASDLENLRLKIPYFRQLGLTYLHLMPLFKSPPGENDGGYAVSSYREVNPSLGASEQLRLLARDLHENGIVLVLDFILNHTASDHEWAQRALLGDPYYQKYYYIFPDRTMPDAYEQHLREIFPDEHPGAFSPLKISTRPGGPPAWAWTTFHSYQWDLNYSNPATFNQMASEMLYLANQGADVLRLDALAFAWKELGTVCESLPKAHTLIQAFNAVARIAAPGLLFKSEAIVHPDDVVRYISPQECQLSYNPLLMALLWNSLATRKVRLLRQALGQRFRIDPACAWINYIRCHDDIGWTFSDEDAAILGVKGYDHRRFLNEFYTGRFPGSFARGLPFQENPKTGDCRISGACASLAGLEKALREEGPREVDLAVRRILLLHGIILSVGGIPLLYLGDEIATLNDYTFRLDPDKARDSRWVHRPAADPMRYERRTDPSLPEGKVYQGLSHLIALRKATPALAGGDMQVFPTGSDHVLGYTRRASGEQLWVLANFSESPQAPSLPPEVAAAQLDLVSGETLPASGWTLAPYQMRWLKK